MSAASSALRLRQAPFGLPVVPLVNARTSTGSAGSWGTGNVGRIPGSTGVPASSSKESMSYTWWTGWTAASAASSTGARLLSLSQMASPRISATASTSPGPNWLFTGTAMPPAVITAR